MNMEKNKIIPIFIPHIGCPHDCVFCNQKRISGTKTFSIEQVLEEIENYLSIYSYTKNLELAFYGGSFTMIDDSLQEQLLSIGKSLVNQGKIKGVRISTRPDGINNHIVKRLVDYNVETVELGVQSTSDKVLTMSSRGHSYKDVKNGVSILKSAGLKIGLQQMIGLPGDTIEFTLKTTKDIIGLKPDFVRIYPTLVIKNTELEYMYERGEYSPLSLNDGVEWVSKIVPMYQNAGIKIIRIGLQSSEDLQYNKSVVEGPLHDAFGELVWTRLYLDKIKNSINNLGADVCIYGSSRDIGILVGQKAIGKIELIDFYNIDEISFRYDQDIESTFKIVSDENIYYLDMDDD